MNAALAATAGHTLVLTWSSAFLTSSTICRMMTTASACRGVSDPGVPSRWLQSGRDTRPYDLKGSGARPRSLLQRTEERKKINDVV